MTNSTVADLIGESLDMAVALADGHRVRRSTIQHAPGIHEQQPGWAWEFIRRPSTAWAPGPQRADGKGPTPLIAAMRAYVASRFGETIDLP